MESVHALNILLADDDEEDQELIEEAIMNCAPNAVLHKVNDGKAVLDYLDALQDGKLPALIILDYNMPQMKGSEVLFELRSMPRYRNVPKVILSTSSTSVYIHECMSKGATDYFVKPNTQRELDNMAEKMLSYAAQL